MVTKSFKQAFGRTMDHEQGFVDDPVDPGGMTYMGISRRWWPSWPGWLLVDKHLRTDKLFSLDLSLAGHVKNFYLINFWNRIQGDLVSKISEEIACELFDTAVNLDVPDAVEFLQQGLNLLNRNQLLFSDMIIDGKLGPVTIKTLERYLSLRPMPKEQREAVLLKIMNTLQGNHYIQQMITYPQNERFTGWFNRI